MAKRLNTCLNKFAETIYSLMRVIIGFTIISIPKPSIKRDNCFILGNGPSLKNNLEYVISNANSVDIFCVNFFANDRCFCQIKPNNYVLLDPLFWLDNLPENTINKRKHLFEVLFISTNWDMNIFIPVQGRDVFKGYDNPNIKIIYFNKTPVLGFRAFRNLCYKLNLGMPVPQNVLVAAIFLSIQLRYKKVYLFGADHSWHQELVVGNDNTLYVRQVHFNDNNVELVPFYKPGNKDTFKVHEIFNAWSRVFRSYLHLQRYAELMGTEIFNVTNKSFIDAFKRHDIN